jgi:hypothetical protein
MMRITLCGWSAAACRFADGAQDSPVQPIPDSQPGDAIRTVRSHPALQPSGQPRLSPYLNLLRGGNPAANYMGVVPEIERRRFESQAIAGFQDLERRAAARASGEDDLFPCSCDGAPRAVQRIRRTTTWEQVGQRIARSRSEPARPSDPGYRVTIRAIESFRGR